MTAQLFYCISSVKPEISEFEGAPLHWFTPSDFQVAECRSDASGTKAKIRFRHPDTINYPDRWVNGWVVLSSDDMSPSSWALLQEKLDQDEENKDNPDRFKPKSGLWHPLGVSSEQPMLLGMRVVRCDLDGVEFQFELCTFYFTAGSLALKRNTGEVKLANTCRVAVGKNLIGNQA